MITDIERILNYIEEQEIEIDSSITIEGRAMGVVPYGDKGFNDNMRYEFFIQDNTGIIYAIADLKKDVEDIFKNIVHSALLASNETDKMAYFFVDPIIKKADGVKRSLPIVGVTEIRLHIPGKDNVYKIGKGFLRQDYTNKNLHMRD